jgi:hypothetical protein
MKYSAPLPVGLSLIAVVVAMCPAHAQPMRPPTETAVIASTPGKASAAVTVDATAKVLAVDNASRTLTLQGPRGGTLEVVAGEEVRNFNQIRVGDLVVATYREALSLELRKSKGGGGATETEVAARAAKGERPGAMAGRETRVTAEVIEVDRAKSVIALKGPRGNVVELKVNNPDHFKVVRKGDQVDAVYTEAIAIAVRPAAPKSDK